MFKLLEGIRVIEMGHIALGPLAAQMLGDYGADVIKVESPGGDLYRANGIGRNRGMTAQWMACNRNKRSIAIDLKKAEGKAVLRELLAGADAFLHNMRPPAIKRLGFDYEHVKQIKPDIVYCFSGGFGQDGPYRDYPAFDDIIQAYSGIAAANGVQTGRPELVPMVVCDTMTGQALGQAVLAGLLSRQLHGEGVCVEVPMYELVVSALMNQHLSGESFIPAEGPLGYKRVLDPDRRPGRTKDGFMVHGVYKLENWRNLFTKLGRTDLLASGMVDDPHTVAANIGNLYKIMLNEILPMRTSAEWRVLFDELDIPYGEVQGMDELLDDEHLKAVGLFEEYDHPTEGRVRQVRQPVAVTGRSRQADIPPPVVGQDTREVLADIGMDEAQIEQLVANNVVTAN
jgi:crotonobetainyl-CoA:carnitine CoA-transferase CaiB-like acyl-CoA transferase